MSLLSLIRFITSHPLTRQRKLAAISCFTRWQIGSRLIGSPVAVDFVNQTRLLVRRGMTGATGNIYTGLHEFEDMAFVLHLLGKDDLFVDIGANVGTYTVLAAGAAGANCISVEPVPSTFGHLMDNINLNGVMDMVRGLNIGIGGENANLRFTVGLDTMNHVASADDANIETRDVPIRTLDDVMGDLEPLLIKIDVEGYETNVIAGAHNTLSRDSLLGVIIELNGSGDRYGFDETKLHQKMMEYGFKSFKYEPFGRRLVSLDGKNSQSGNTLYLRNLGEVESRLRRAPRFEIRSCHQSI